MVKQEYDIKVCILSEILNRLDAISSRRGIGESLWLIDRADHPVAKVAAYIDSEMAKNYELGPDWNEVTVYNTLYVPNIEITNEDAWLRIWLEGETVKINKYNTTDHISRSTVIKYSIHEDDCIDKIMYLIKVSLAPRL